MIGTRYCMALSDVFELIFGSICSWALIRNLISSLNIDSLVVKVS